VFCDPRFVLHGYKAIWTADGEPSGPAHWCVDFQNGHCDTLYHDPKGFVLPVRRVDLEATCSTIQSARKSVPVPLFDRRMDQADRKLIPMLSAISPIRALNSMSPVIRRRRHSSRLMFIWIRVNCSRSYLNSP